MGQGWGAENIPGERNQTKRLGLHRPSLPSWDERGFLGGGGHMDKEMCLWLILRLGGAHSVLLTVHC